MKHPPSAQPFLTDDGEWRLRSNNGAVSQAVIGTCPNCKDKFICPKRQYKPNKSTCSPSCAATVRNQKIPTGKNSPYWKGYGDIPGRFWSRVQEAAASRKIEVRITLKQAWELFQIQKGRCALTGTPLRFSSRPLSATTASLDRIDSSRPYCLDNVWWIHKQLNVMKQDFTLSYFLDMCEAVAKNEKSKKTTKAGLN